ncbi:Phenylacetic acid catabolic protein [Halobacterium sp. KA-6]|uniref:Phenylacetic acid catabolic protein n=1 Tax=Halobacterium sp. KA-6 TaxID=2896368 RepID=UPI001E320954|nr:Phenylacetic acid catabolic protein [Halobacterium sp. KA-6]MCD2204042.1 1,2-phenylacetyl-CoA epoxidase subunit A [Halobacterium sp. KA-6]
MIGFNMPQSSEDRSLEERVQNGEIIEDPDELTDEYKQLMVGMLQAAGNVEFMGAFSEGHWLQNTPDYQTKLAFNAKIQDEIGHAQMQWRVAESLGADRREMIEKLMTGETTWGAPLHYPVEEWLDVVMVALTIDTSASHILHQLQQSSYGPLRRQMRRNCREEEFHTRWGQHMAAKHATGSKAQQEALQDAFERWWPRAVRFFGKFSQSDHIEDRLKELRIRPATSDEIRQNFFDNNVPTYRKLGLEIPDDKFRYDKEEEKWVFTAPDPNENPHIVPAKQLAQGNGPKTQERLEGRRRAFDAGQWVVDAMDAYAKQQAQNQAGNAPATGD